MSVAYEILRPLSSDRTLLARGAGGRLVVLKQLDPDCLQDGQLHESIAERLQRIRELPEPAIANMHGVERVNGGVFIVREYVEGVPLVDAASPEPLLRELRLIARRMHQHGIVHGAIHERNVIVTPDRRVRLVDVSPLLYADPLHDEQAIDGISQRLLGCGADAAESAEADIEGRRLRARSLLAAVITATAALLLFLYLRQVFA